MHNHKLIRKVISSLISCAVITSTLIFSTANASAAPCKPVKAIGKTVGEIALGNTSMIIKSFNYPAGGKMEPQPTTSAAGLSARHMPLSSNVGSSIIVWHRNFNHCAHPLNVFFSKSKGSKFELVDENGEAKTYKIVDIRVTSKGDYKKSWFNLIGPRQVVLITCTGVFKLGHYEKNLVVIATPL